MYLEEDLKEKIQEEEDNMRELLNQKKKVKNMMIEIEDIEIEKNMIDVIDLIVKKESIFIK